MLCGGAVAREPPKSSSVRRSLTKMLQLLAKHYKIISGRSTSVNRTRIGTWEILQMMDFDIQETQCIELTECHHLA